MTDVWPWLALAGLGLFHGLNPAMGWLFAVALGLHRGSHRVVLLSLIPIALGHAASVAAVLLAVLAIGLVLDHRVLARAAGAALLAWAAWHWVYGHRQRLIVGMRTGLAGLALWSFVMASAHGAGLMLVPAMLPICTAAESPSGFAAQSAFPLALAGVGVHSAAMLATIGAVSTLVYRWLGVDVLRRGWINFDRIWIAALAICGFVLLAT